MLPVYINGRFLTQSVTGVQRYAIEAVRSLDQLLDETSGPPPFRLLVPGTDRAELPLRHIETIPTGSRRGHLWEQTDLFRASRDGVLVSLANTGPVLHRRHIVTVHDAGVFANPATFSWAFRSWYRILLPILMRRAKGLLTVSEFSKRELARYCGVGEGKFDVVPNGADHITREAADGDTLARHGVEAGSYVLFVGSKSPNKNVALILEAISLLDDPDLVFVAAGGANPRVFANVAPTPDPRLRTTGYLTDPQLRELYANALCFVFPSFYEGFGIPPLEAMLCGCPAIVADTSSLPEACGEAALYCDPHDAKDLAAKIDRIRSDTRLRARLKEDGLAHAAKYTWRASAARILSVISRHSA